MGKSKKTVMEGPSCLIDKKNKKWVIDGYYIDEKGTAWTLLSSFDDPSKHKKIKGVI